MTIRPCSNFELPSLIEPADTHGNTGKNNKPPSFEELPKESRQIIFSYVAEASELKDAKMFCASRSVSKVWRSHVNSHADKYILPFYWDKLKETKSPQLQALVEQIDQKCNSKKARIEQSPSNLTKKGSQINTLFWERFTRLTEELQKRGASISLHTPILGILLSQYEKKLKELDDSLVTVWGKIQRQIDFNGVPVPQSAHEIRIWLNDPTNAGLIGRITNLELSHLGLVVLPSEISKLVNLTHLNVCHNQLTNLPETIGKLVNLTHFDVCHNQLTNLPETIGNLINLTHFNVYQNQLTNLPETIGNLINLTVLYLEDNQLTNLPETIGNLVNLKELCLEDNQLTNLPETIGNLVNLTVLYLSYNQLTSVPEAIGNLVNLTRLFIGKNRLTNLPKTIGKLHKLTNLFLENNQLTNLPKTIGNLGKLEELNLSNNQLTNLPEIAHLDQLETLDLSNNRLTNLPKAIGNLGKLKTFYRLPQSCSF